MNKQSYQCRRVAGREEAQQIGDFFWIRNDAGKVLRIGILMPNLRGNGMLETIRVSREASSHPAGQSPIWQWDGNENTPTLEPSLDWAGVWHGHLQAGRLVSCP